MPSSPAHLFVYGSLMRDQPGRRLLGPIPESEPAAVHGRLYHLPAGYPMLVWDPAGDPVEGELVRLPDPATTLARLDRYEGYDPASPASSDYLRVAHPVHSNHRPDAIPAWMYVAPPGWTPCGHLIRPAAGGSVRWDRDRPRRRSPP